MLTGVALAMGRAAGGEASDGETAGGDAGGEEGLAAPAGDEDGAGAEAAACGATGSAACASCRRSTNLWLHEVHFANRPNTSSRTGWTDPQCGQRTSMAASSGG
ncbi:MAG: hypothetical protein AAF589_00960 [Planctomycetota bacterium]